MSASNEPKIGIFDSGMGGLTVAHAIAQALPQENLLYFGDTMHAPWGDKSQTTVQAYVTRIVDYLLSENCKAIVVACNTASALVYHDIQKQVGQAALLLNVIDPIVNHIEAKHRTATIGLLATKQTVHSQAYPNRIAKQAPQAKVKALATPLLVPLIEEGYLNSPVSNQILADYLQHPRLQEIEALILGCTHYPLLQKQITAFYQHQNRDIEIIDSAQLTAQFLKTALQSQGMLNTSKREAPRYQFYVSDDNPFFSDLAKLFFGKAIRVQKRTLSG